MKDNEIINVECRQVPTSRPKTNATLFIAFVTISPAFLAGGAALGKWSGDFAMGGLLLVAAFSLVLGLLLRVGRRISSLFGVTAAIGLGGLSLALANLNVWLSLFGLAAGGLSILMMQKIEARRWTYE